MSQRMTIVFGVDVDRRPQCRVLRPDGLRQDAGVPLSHHFDSSEAGSMFPALFPWQECPGALRRLLVVESGLDIYSCLVVRTVRSGLDTSIKQVECA